MTDPGFDGIGGQAPLYQPEPEPYDRLLPGPYFTVQGEPPVTVRVAREQDGTLVCTGLLVGWGDEPKKLTARALAGIRLPAILEAIATIERDDAGELRAAAPKIGKAPVDLRWWAGMYFEAQRFNPSKPIAQMAIWTGKSHSTVHRMVARCRDRGLLPRSYRRQA